MLTKNMELQRKKGIGGSDVAPILGVSSYKSPYDIWLDKTTDNIENEKNMYQLAGSCLESAIIKMYEHMYNVTIQKHDFLKDADCPFLIGNIDGILTNKNEKILIEIKNQDYSQYYKWGEEYTDQIPIEYYCQVAHYCMIGKFDKAKIIVLFGGNNLKEYEYIRNTKFEEFIREREINFWNNNVIKKIPPKMRRPEELLKLYPYAKNNTIISNNSIIEKIKAYKKLEKEKLKINSLQELFKLDIMEFMKENDTLLTPDEKEVIVTWRNIKNRTSFDSALLKKEHPDIYKNYIKISPSTTRRFIIK